MISIPCLVPENLNCLWGGELCRECKKNGSALLPGSVGAKVDSFMRKMYASQVHISVTNEWVK